MVCTSYGHAYLTSYGWTGSGTGLRKGAIKKPLAIPPKKNLSGLGKDRDEAFPFWDQYVRPIPLYVRLTVKRPSLFTAASKTITIKVSTDDDDDDPENPVAQSDPASTSVPLRRTTTGIISNRRPVSGTPASISGSTTPNPNPDTDMDVPDTNDEANTGITGRLSLMATAKREGRQTGPVLGPNDDPHAGVNTASHSASTSVDSSSVSTPIHDRGGAQDGVTITRETKKSKSKKRKPEDREETKEGRKERKRLKKERKAARAAKKTEKSDKVEKKKERSGDIEQKARRQRGEVPSEENETCSQSKMARKRARKSTACVKGRTGGYCT
ncbi:hypothetical protein JVU11DRAFT_3443 [Chiua virens]|nr:hypothetical protein JVU11DRAFT_3443 [Chiua virens]